MIKKSQIAVLGALALVAGFMGAGFQGNADKIGVVDLNRLVSESKYGQARMKTLNVQLKSRKELMDFLGLYKVATAEMAQKLRGLMLKDPLADAEKTELDKLKASIMESDKKFQELRQRQNYTDAERELVREFSLRSEATDNMLARWSQEFQDELGNLQDEARKDTLKKAKDALTDVSKAGSFTIIFESTYAPYSANDVTETALKSMDSKG